MAQSVGIDHLGAAGYITSECSLRLPSGSGSLLREINSNHCHLKGNSLPAASDMQKDSETL